MNKDKINVITTGFATAWIIGILSFVSGTLCLFANGRIIGLLFYLITLLVFPPLNDYYFKVFKVKFTIQLRIVFTIVLLIMIIIINNTYPIQQNNNKHLLVDQLLEK